MTTETPDLSTLTDAAVARAIDRAEEAVAAAQTTEDWTAARAQAAVLRDESRRRAAVSLARPEVLDARRLGAEYELTHGREPEAADLALLAETVSADAIAQMRAEGRAYQVRRYEESLRRPRPVRRRRARR